VLSTVDLLVLNSLDQLLFYDDSVPFRRKCLLVRFIVPYVLLVYSHHFDKVNKNF
jgi:hypothetical protein